MKAGLFGILLLATASAGGREADPAKAADPRADGVCRGVAFLLKDQNPDGSWGSFKETLPSNAGWPAEAYRSWRVATTGLCCMALMRLDQAPEAVSRGVDFLLANAALKRPNEWDTDHVWGWVYALESLALAEVHPSPSLASRRDRIRPVVDGLLRDLLAFQGPTGGWGYYDFERTGQPPVWATSFTTANAVLALRAAREAGHKIPEARLKEALKGIRLSRFPNGSYSYTVARVREEARWWAADHLKFSLARIQVCNLALSLEGEGIGTKELAEGLDLFFEHHKFLDMARYHPIPHDAYYANSGYFYLYGHAYAAEVIDRLPEALQAKYRALLDRETLKLQEPDGSWWDYPFMGYAKPSGTAFALLALAPRG